MDPLKSINVQFCSCTNSSVAVLQCSHGPWEFKCAHKCVPSTHGNVNCSVQLSSVAQAYGSVSQRSSTSVGGERGWCTVGGVLWVVYCGWVKRKRDVLHRSRYCFCYKTVASVFIHCCHTCITDPHCSMIGAGDMALKEYKMGQKAL